MYLRFIESVECGMNPRSLRVEGGELGKQGELDSESSIGYTIMQHKRSSTPTPTHTHPHTHTPTHKPTHTHLHIPTHLYTHKHADTHIHTCRHTHTRTHIRLTDVFMLRYWFTSTLVTTTAFNVYPCVLLLCYSLTIVVTNACSA